MGTVGAHRHNGRQFGSDHGSSTDVALCRSALAGAGRLPRGLLAKVFLGNRNPDPRGVAVALLAYYNLKGASASLVVFKSVAVLETSRSLSNS